MNRLVFFTLSAILISLIAVSLIAGATHLSAVQVAHTLIYGGEYDFVVNQYRLPRVILAIGVGAGLGLSGILVQGIIRNPLASPDLMGISAGAGLAATALMVFFPQAPNHLLSLSALFGGMSAAAIIYIINTTTQPTPTKLALIGVSISAFLASLIDFLMVVHPMEINTAMVWLTGSLWGRNWTHVPTIWFTLVVLVPYAFWLAWRLDILGLGDDSATSLGVTPTKLQWRALLCAVVLASLSVSICGTISFVGLLAPHLAKMLFGHQHKALIPGAALIGGSLVLASDTLARGLQRPIELPAGVLTSLIGAPYFIYLLQRYKGW